MNPSSETVHGERSTANGNQKNFSLIIITLIAAAVFIVVVYKTATTSLTHDEGSTYLNLIEGSSLNLWSCYHNPVCWSTANNHLLNTVMMRWSIHAFGTSELALRLPNLLLFLIYLLCVITLLRDTISTVAEGIFGIACFICNPFVLDFFGLARGYGMGLGLMMLSMVAMWKYFGTRQSMFITLAFIAAVASVFANLIYLPYVMALTAGVSFYVLLPDWRRAKRFPWKVATSMSICLLFLLWYFYRPVRMLIDLGEFEHGSTSLWECWMNFARDSLYGKNWIGENTISVFAIGSAVLLGICIALAFIRPQGRREVEIRYARFSAFIFVMIVVFLMLSHLITGAYYPVGRKSIILFPIPALLLYFTVTARLKSKPILNQAVVATIGILLLSHLALTFNLRVFREWWYDASTKDMVYYVSSKGTKDQRATLATEWIFRPSTQYYLRTRTLNIKLSEYSRDIVKELSDEYYYVHPEHVAKLEPDFSVEKNFDGRLLMKKAMKSEE